MTDSNHQLQTQFEAFEKLHPARSGDERKRRVRELEAEVKNDKIHITSDQLQQYLASEKELPRILAYLLIENVKVNSDQSMWRANVLSEWELLRRRGLGHDCSRMPLYYAVRAYFTRLKGAPDSKVAARDDVALIREIESRLAESEIDRKSQLGDRVRELLTLLEGSPSNPALDSVLISRRGVIAAAIITTIGAILVGVLTNLDKISSWFAQSAPRASAPKK